MSVRNTHDWGHALRTTFAFSHHGHGDKPLHHDVQHRMLYLDNAEMAREMGHL